MPKISATELRQAFRAIPKEQRDAQQSFAIRVWRGLSWLERAEQANDAEGRFISCWIGFNALYGQLDDDNRPWGEREALGTFLATIWRLDEEESIRQLLGKRQLAVLHLIESKYLYDKFWSQPQRNHEHALRQTVRKMLARFGTSGMLPILQTLFDRLYIMRVQVFHGASTKGSSLNRRTLIQSGDLLRELLPVMINVMIRHGVEAEWGRICFPPIK